MRKKVKPKLVLSRFLPSKLTLTCKGIRCFPEKSQATAALEI